MSSPNFWDNPDGAQAVIRRRKSVSGPLKLFDDFSERLEEAMILAELAEEEEDSSALQEVASEIKKLRAGIADLRLSILLSGEYDGEDAIVTIQPGAGGLDAQDWAEMLFRMYNRWAEKSGFEIEIMEALPAEEGGLKNGTVSVKGKNAYGYLKVEQGVHRLVRISPFDSSGRRHTSFASVEVMPDLPNDDDVEINEDDLRIDTFRASGAGGQHVNKADTAVRITHQPTGVVASCQNERSQHKNRTAAMKILRGKLRQRKEEERRKEMARLRGEQDDIAWGSQIRSYVFHPYNMVKDHRTGVEKGNIEAVMDGDLDDFVRAYLEEMAGMHEDVRSTGNDG